MTIWRIAFVISGLVTCATAASLPTDVHVVSSKIEVPSGCRHVGSVPLGIGNEKPDLTREQLRIELAAALLESAKKEARSWDADMIVFSPVFETGPSDPAFQWAKCGCEAYRCAATQESAFREVPLVALLANPEAFYGQMVEIVAWGAVEFELAALFRSSEDLRHISFSNAVSLDAPEEAFSALPLPFSRVHVR